MSRPQAARSRGKRRDIKLPDFSLLLLLLLFFYFIFFVVAAVPTRLRVYLTIYICPVNVAAGYDMLDSLTTHASASRYSYLVLVLMGAFFSRVPAVYVP